MTTHPEYDEEDDEALASIFTAHLDRLLAGEPIDDAADHRREKQAAAEMTERRGMDEDIGLVEIGSRLIEIEVEFFAQRVDLCRQRCSVDRADQGHIPHGGRHSRR